MNDVVAGDGGFGSLQAEPKMPIVRNRTEGHIISCDGERAVIAADAGKQAAGSEDYWAVGQMISIRVGEARLVGLIFRVDVTGNNWESSTKNVIHIHVELVGQVSTGPDGELQFSTGIADYPYMGAVAHRIRNSDLKAIYANVAPNAVPIGNLTQEQSIPALIDIDKLLARHFAVVGTTGVGKSTAVTLLLRKIVQKRPDVRVLLLDPHNEFTTAFADKAITVDANRLDLPFWVFRLDEFAEVVFRGRTPVANELDALRDLIPLAKERFRRGEGGSLSSSMLKKDRETTSLTADTPVPYRMVDLLQLLDERAGQLDGKADRPHLRALRNRLESLLNDPRFRFMFGAKTVSDTMPVILSHVFRIPQNGRPICVFDMSNLPSEVVNSVVSVFCRMAFDLALNSDGGLQTLVVCEEAHRYIPSDKESGFWPTRQAIARIAKEGRKYGVYLGVVTQRPGELDPTILSQCNTIFAMRLGNEHDQDIIKLAITGAARSLTNFLSSVGNRECIAFGEAFQSPMRMRFETIARKDLPGAHIYAQQERLKSGTSEVSLVNVLHRMRNNLDIEDDETAQWLEPSSPSIDDTEALLAAISAPGDGITSGSAGASHVSPQPGYRQGYSHPDISAGRHSGQILPERHSMDATRRLDAQHRFGTSQPAAAQPFKSRTKPASDGQPEVTPSGREGNSLIREFRTRKQ
ncbi:ATP-binding protein [Zhengella sp. ZM62]|uniref:ATP-binding protein n=1 Tax=Zhengella sedimenti TaxID=3390035 RepID=UPI00397512E4